jgi:hypothetical protein
MPAPTKLIFVSAADKELDVRNEREFGMTATAFASGRTVSEFLPNSDTPQFTFLTDIANFACRG